MSTQQENQAELANVPDIAARYRAASSSASTQQLANAMALLQKSAAGAVFPREATSDDAPAPDVPSKKMARTCASNELAFMSRRSPFRTSEREASRRYAGAKTVI
ncbi:hypothetical protein [Tritonibacter horizontis]|uniref:Uncharacterized protein n=1 Tax=Tritonibacter horizontis TaxID=1768241 RepID=A0A132BVI1_9RHOB|nr:hypothetical protein [Tritonibacter horizontis]KUP92399.1 hypothetical protein TRIHO_27030 [Tritonibacter horizontis]